MTASPLCLGGLLFLIVCGAPAIAQEKTGPPLASVKVKLKGVDVTVPVIQLDDGSHRFVFKNSDGTEEPLTPDQFAARVFDEQTHRPMWMRVLNITSMLGVAWVALGLLGQVLFTGRMIVQWLVSEKHRKSVVPNVFWWMSLGGASMLLAYFIWRKDIVGILGQATGWFIYVRNLYFIYSHHDTSIADDPGPEPELAESPSRS